MYGVNQQRTKRTNSSGPSSARILWKRKLSMLGPDESFTGPVVLDVKDNAYYASDFGIYCITPHGDVSWTYPTLSLGHYHQTLAIDKTGSVYAVDKEGELICVRAPGILVWKTQQLDNSGVCLYPTILSDGSVVVFCNECVTKVSNLGNVLWSFSLLNLGGSAGGAGAISQSGQVFVATAGGYVASISSTGKLAHLSAQIDRLIGNSDISIDSGASIYVSSVSGRLNCLNNRLELVWSRTIQTSENCIKAPAIAGSGDIFFATYDGEACRYTNSGKEIWKCKLSSPNPVCAASVILDSNNNMYFSTKDSILWSISESGTINWKVALDAKPGRENYGEVVISSKGRIYIICSSGYLYCID